MKQHKFLLVILIAIPVLLQAQFKPSSPAKSKSDLSQIPLEAPKNIFTSVPKAENKLQVDQTFSIQPSSIKRIKKNAFAESRLDVDKEGTVYLNLNIPPKQATVNVEDVLPGLYSKLDFIDTNHEFITTDVQKDELGFTHVRLQQTYQDVPVFGAELVAHFNGEKWYLINGKSHNFSNVEYIEQRITPDLAADKAVSVLKSINAYFSTPTKHQIEALKTGTLHNQLVWYSNNDNQDFQLVYHLTIKPNPMERWEVFIDALTGEEIDKYESLCKFNHTRSYAGHHNIENHTDLCTHDHPVVETTEQSPTGPETATAQDLFNINRTINVWKEGSTYYMIDGARSIFNAGSSNMPDDPIGAIWTIDAFNTSPALNSFRYDHVKSNINTWSNKTAVSAHYNGGKAFEYFENVHVRKSINGKSGTIISFINVTDENNRQMDNAFWNGEAMFYGNGDQAFTALAKALDVGGHEMSHGVIQNTANLNYQSESGALNESFADIFGAMIDRNDWKMGEDVVRLSQFPSGALRDLSNPHNGAQTNDFGRWQPRHVTEQYKGSEDNGGVHINSGIPNYAFYLFVQELAKNRSEEDAKKIAEKVYYRALTNYLTRSSKFVDMRIAAENAAKDLHGAGGEVFLAVQKAFAAVGIGGTTGGGGGGNYQNDLPVNPGEEYIVLTDDKGDGIYLAKPGGAATKISNTFVISKPSVRDDGSVIVFVGGDKKVHALILQNGVYREEILTDQPIWLNVAISKQGDKLGLLTTDKDNILWVYDYTLMKFKDFKLTNPTYTQGVVTGDVRFADFMDFNNTGEYIMYDALSEIKQSNGNSYEYWDIGFINVFDNKTKNFAAGKIDKLFSDIEENTSLGNPVFSKNSPYIIAFDFIEEGFIGENFYVIGGNIETQDFEVIFENDKLGYPSYSVKDNKVIFNATDNSNNAVLAVVDVEQNKIKGLPATAKVLYTGGYWGNWYAVGTRKLDAVSNLEGLKAISVFPNPTQSDVNLTLDVTEVQSVSLSILNMLGVEVHNQKERLQTGNNTIQLPINHMIPGSYVLRISNSNGSQSILLNKQ